MRMAHTIEDLEGLEVTAIFEFHREIDGQIVFDGAWDILSVIGDDGEDVTDQIDDDKINGMIIRWLGEGNITGEDKLYTIINSLPVA